MTSQNYLQLLHEKSDSFPKNLATYANTNNSIHSGISTSLQSSESSQTLPNSDEKDSSFLNKEETYNDLPALPEKLLIRSKTESTNPVSAKNFGLQTAINNHFETSSEPHMNSDELIGIRTNIYKYGSECMDSRRSS